MYRLMSLVFLLTVSAQSITIKGIVKSEETGLPISGVVIDAGEIYSVTGKDGRFTLDVRDVDMLRVEKIGYERNIIERADFEKDLQVLLKIDPFLLSEVVVESNFIEKSLSEIASSLSIRSGETVESFGGARLEHVIESVPNVSRAGGTSRPRYLQIRGIGERSQYAGDGPPNFAVGYHLDGIDLSGLSAGGMFDVKQVEIFRGPHSSVFGPNSLAGTINVKSADPSSVLSGKVRLDGGSDGLLSSEIVLNTPLNHKASVRLGYQNSYSNGFRSNKFLDRDDTNKRHEEIIRFKGKYLSSGGIAYNMTVIGMNADNGYEMWSPDNNKELHTFANQIGSDDLQLKAVALQTDWPVLEDRLHLVSISTLLQTKMEYSYDGDWGNDSYWLSNHGHDPSEEGWKYEYFDKTSRTREVVSQEFRLRFLEVDEWNIIFGTYLKKLQESDEANGYLFSGLVSSLDAKFENSNIAVYVAADRLITPNTSLVVNSRFERSGLNYTGETNSDNLPLESEFNDWFWGGNVSLVKNIDSDKSIYFSLSRGYLPGGINQHPNLNLDNRLYDPEYMTNMEIGYKWITSDFSIQSSMFHAFRSEQQVSLSTQQDLGDPNSFFYYRSNAANGTNSGIEIESGYSLTTSLRGRLSYAFLSSYVNSFKYDLMPNQFEYSGDRETAHAPKHRIHCGIEWSDNHGFSAELAGTYTSDFYFSDSHNQKSDPYSLVDGSVGYMMGKYQIEGWIRNIFNERYATRGFFFGLEPPDYPEKLYKSYGDPRQVGLRVTKEW